MSETLTELIEKVYEKYSDDNDIWLLLQAIVQISQDIEKIKRAFEL